MLAWPLRSDLDLGAVQHEPGLDRVFDQVIVARAAVLRDVAIASPASRARTIPTTSLS